MLKLLNVLEILGLFGSFWDCIGLLLVCFGLCCAALWCECVDSCGVCRVCFWCALGVLGIVEVL